MASYLTKYRPGKPIFANPGPTNIPDSVMTASAHPSIDFTDEDFTNNVYLPSVQKPADLWGWMARNLGIATEVLSCPIRTGLDLQELRKRLLADTLHELKAVCVVHNETSTGVTLPLKDIRRVMDETRHPALFLVDTISSFVSIDFRMDEWGVDGVVCGSQKGLMLPTGVAFTAVSPKGMAASQKSTLPKHYFNWQFMAKRLPHKSFAGTIPTNMFLALKESLRLIDLEGGLDAVLARHHRLAEAVRRCVRHWGRGDHGAKMDGAPEIFCADPQRYSDSITGVIIPGEGMPAAVKAACSRMGVVVGSGIGRTGGVIIRIGHLGDNNEAAILAILAVVEDGLVVCKVPHHKGGVTRAIAYLAETSGSSTPSKI